ncbi:MAG: S4 domain-containing protein [Vicinamibacterales bacterium]
MPSPAPVAVRIDIWLDVSCLFKTRSEAQQALKLGKVMVNGDIVKAHRALKVGDELLISRQFGRKQRLLVRGLTDQHVARADARTLYEDLTTPPTPEEIEMRRAERLFRAATPAKAPDKRDRRALRKLKEGG